MNILLDTCVWGGVRLELKNAGHDVVWAGDWDQDPGDEDILALAYREKRILVTLDKDFGELVMVRGLPHSGIVRLVNISAKKQASYCLYVLNTYTVELASGALIEVERDRIRIRKS